MATSAKIIKIANASSTITFPLLFLERGFIIILLLVGTILYN